MLLAKDIMTREVIVAHENASIKELAKLLAENSISGMPVVDDQGEVIGVVTENDLIDQTKKVHIPTVLTILDAFLFLESPQKLEDDLQKMAAVKAGEICSKMLVEVTEETGLDEVATLMSEKKIHTLPVMRGNELVGVIGKSDIIRTLARE